MGNCGLAASATGNESASAPLNTLARLAKTSGVDEFNHLRPLASRCGSGLNSQQQAELTAALKSLKLELGVGAHSKALREVRQLLVKLYSVTNLVEDHHHITFCLQVLEARDKETETSNGGKVRLSSSAVSASVVMTKPRSRASSYGSYGDLKQRSGSCGDDSMLSMHSHSSSNSDGVGRGSRLNKV